MRYNGSGNSAGKHKQGARKGLLIGLYLKHSTAAIYGYTRG
jgi:hypothetical protein